MHAHKRNRNPGKTGRLGVAPDCLHSVAEPRTVEHNVQDNGQRHEKDSDDRNDAKYFHRGEREEAARLVGRKDRAALVGDERQPLEH